jgi:Family of unknown function (DUF6152)
VTGRRTAAWVAALAFAVVAAPHLSAHHSFAMFDTAKRVTLVGTVTAFEWTNPHVYIELDVPAEKDGAEKDGAAKGGAVKHWSVELGSPSILQQGGWKFSDVKVGDKLTAVINPLRNGDAGGLLFQVTLRDGRVLGNGPGRGAAQ